MTELNDVEPDDTDDEAEQIDGHQANLDGTLTAMNYTLRLLLADFAATRPPPAVEDMRLKLLSAYGPETLPPAASPYRRAVSECAAHALANLATALQPSAGE